MIIITRSALEQILDNVGIEPEQITEIMFQVDDIAIEHDLLESTPGLYGGADVDISTNLEWPR